MAIEVFNRYENKYIVHEKILGELLDRLSEYMDADAYNKCGKAYTITNLYYDTPNNHLIRTSLSKPKYKEKLRLRAYGVPDAYGKVYLEIKKKVNGLTNKRRSAMILSEAYQFLETGVLPEKKQYQNRQVLSEVKYMLEMHELRPALYLAYDRIAYFGIGQRDLRISFDQKIRTRRYDLKLEPGDYGKPLLDNGQWLMEVKAAHSLPIWLCHLLSIYKIYPTSFSKYGVEYQQTLETKKTPKIFSFTPAMPELPRTAAIVATR